MSSLEEDDLIAATHMKSSSLEALVPFFRTRFSSMQVLVCGTSSKSNLIDFELVMSPIKMGFKSLINHLVNEFLQKVPNDKRFAQILYIEPTWHVKIHLGTFLKIRLPISPSCIPKVQCYSIVLLWTIMMKKG